ncbi:hypothetical protein SLEP1_g46150 [Rubroshorea leprosula]|uniref:Uncharacterized protein n=1 Tax=Rubroshorea leprosula TaxID=152421 RepID=A0AAV5LLH5_9ROSI|nr:hypothetical protein SLEP1_g46150 [Rubroshorea leprosula]
MLQPSSKKESVLSLANVSTFPHCFYLKSSQFTVFQQILNEKVVPSKL